MRNHAQILIACDFPTVVTAHFRVLCVLVVIEISRRRILRYNVAVHPTAAWTAQQFREATPSDHSYGFLIHDHGSIFSGEVDKTIKSLGVKVLRTPVRALQADAYCERLTGTMRRECLDFMSPLSEKHLRLILRRMGYALQSRPVPPELRAEISHFGSTYWRPFPIQSPPACSRLAYRDKSGSLGGLHHEYRLGKAAA